VIIEHVYQQRLRTIGPYQVEPFGVDIHHVRRGQAFFGRTSARGIPAVLKLADPYASENRRRIVQEAHALQALAALQARSVVRLLDHGEARIRLLTDEHVECPFVVLEEALIDAYEWSGGGRRDVGWPVLRAMILQLAEAVAELHAHRWLHGDIKLDNVLLVDSLHRPRPLLADFGSAAPAGRARPRPFAGHLNEYQPADATVTPAWDVYSLGVLLHTLCRTAPWRSVLLRVADAGTFRPTVPPQARPFLGRLLDAALQPLPEDRPSAAEVRDTVRRLPAGTQTTPDDAWQQVITDLDYRVSAAGAQLGWAVFRPPQWPGTESGVKLHVHLLPGSAAADLRQLHSAVLQSGCMAKVPANLRDLTRLAEDPADRLYGKVMTIYPASDADRAALAARLRRLRLALGPGVPGEPAVAEIPGLTWRNAAFHDPRRLMELSDPA
jgi:Protein kinase domain